MRSFAVLLGCLWLAALSMQACSGGGSKPAQVGDAAVSGDAGPDAGSDAEQPGARFRLERPALPRPPQGSLPAELFPPGR